MKGLIQTTKNIWNIKELREKLIITFTFLVVYRFGSYIPLPGIDINEVNRLLAEQTADSQNGLLGLLNSFTGGSFNRASILALGIMPYISASIVIQLMQLAVPYLQKLQKDGESGQKKVNQITRWLTIAICLVQAPAYLTLLQSQLLPYNGAFHSAYLLAPTNFWFLVPSVIILVTGTIFTMWMGEKITDRGIGNGISIIIMVGILADLPQALLNAFELDTTGGIAFMMEILGLLIAIFLCVVLVQAVRKVPVQYVRRAQSGSSSYMRSVTDSVRSYIPLKVNAAGVMPIIFAQAIMFLPATLAGFFADSDSSLMLFFQKVSDPFSWQNNIVFAILIIVFTFFYTAITIPVNQMADDLKRNGGIIPGIKPGKDTAEYLDYILSKITLPGSVFLVLIAVMPALVHIFGVDQRLSMFYGGTSLLIMVAVILDTVQQINTYLLNHHYDGLMSSGRVRNVA